MLGFSLQEHYTIPLSQVVALVRDSGFDAVSPAWTADLDMGALHTCVQACGMFIQSIHAPHSGVPLLWEPDHTLSAAPANAILQSLEDCARYQVPVLVLHGWQGLGYSFPEAPDFRFFDQLVVRASQLGVALAFENLEGEEYHTALLQRYQNEKYVGFCWDSGHDRCYPHQQDYLVNFGDRLIMTHLNDNLGVRSVDGSYSTKDDLHYLPGDGNTDWIATVHRLSSAKPQETLNFELKTHTRTPADDLYDHMTLEQFIAEAGRRARKLESEYRKRTQ